MLFLYSDIWASENGFIFVFYEIGKLCLLEENSASAISHFLIYMFEASGKFIVYQS